MTGETANGRSISVISRLLPRNSNFAMAQAAQMPKTVLAGTTIAAVSSVRRIAARVSGSEKLAEVDLEPLLERLRQHRPERGQQQQREKGDRDGDQQHAPDARPDRDVAPLLDPGRDAGHLSAPPPRAGACPTPARG